jgi:HlyD family secretion protein
MIKEPTGQDQIVTQQPTYKKLTWLAIIAVAVLLGIYYILSNYSRGDLSISKDSVQFATVSQGDLIRDVAATGRIVAANAPTIYSPEQGFINLMVNAGDTVTLGQTVATLNSPALLNQAKQEQAELARLLGELERQKLNARRQTLALNKSGDLAKVQLNAAKREERRAQLSIAKSLISQIDLEKAVDDLSRAELTYQHAQQDVLLAQDTLAFELQSVQSHYDRQQLVVNELNRQVGNLQIKATVAGIVGNLLIQPKAAVSQNQALMTLVDLTAFEAEIQIPESYANDLGLGMVVELTIGNSEVQGQLAAISPEVSNREVTARVRFEQQRMSGIRQNQRLSARILLENKTDIVTVKRGPFLQAGGYVAYKVDGNIAHRIKIDTGVTSMAAVEVLAGLDVGDQIIISNYDKFKQASSIILR